MMAASSSDFILDEGLDDDEDVLAFHSNRHTNTTPPQTPTPPNPSSPVRTPHSQPIHTVIIDGMPPTASRSHLNTFLANTGPITQIRLRRLEPHKILRARVTFEHPDDAQRALSRDGRPFGSGHDAVVSVKPDSAERWEDNPAAETHHTNAVLARLPPRETLATSFWTAFGAARKAAETLEHRARRFGEEVEGRFAVHEKVDGAVQALGNVDRRLGVSDRVGEVAQMGKAMATNLDDKYGLSKGVGRFVGEVGKGVEIVAREVDDNLNLSQRARDVTNRALRHDGIGPAVRTVVDGVGAKEREDTPRKKNYQPSGIEQNTPDNQFMPVPE